MKKWWKEAILQFIPVMFGVYLAFVVSNWQENRHAQAQADQLLANIRSEIQLNSQNLEQYADYHVMLKDSANRYAGASGPASDRPRFFQGIKTHTLLNSAFQTGVQTGILNQLPIKVIQDLNQLYTLQDTYNDYGRILVSGLLNMNFENEQGSFRQLNRFLAVSMSDIVLQERKLLDMYRDIDETLADL